MVLIFLPGIFLPGIFLLDGLTQRKTPNRKMRCRAPEDHHLS